ncbi:MAG TPA: DnaA N-terminal domain-containing protein [Bryobacteraceae bacterium]|nr:DnaA N-terminal domain-containing protein [Bryobacteraceae bacterium]
MAAFAAAAAARKPARAQELPAIPGGYTATPHSFFKRMWRVCDGEAQLGVLANIIDETVGSHRKWASISQPDFAEWLGASAEAIRRAVRALESKQLIETRRPNGVRCEYRALMENFDTVAEREPRELREPPGPVQAGSGLLSLVSSGPKRKVLLGTPVSEVVFGSHTPMAMPVAVDNSVSEGRFYVDIRLQEETPNSSRGFAAPNRPSSSPAEAPGADHNGAGRGDFSELKGLLTPLFQKHLGEPPDEVILREIAEALGKHPPLPYTHYAGKKAASRSNVYSKLFVIWARKYAEGMAAVQPPPKPPAPAPGPSVGESEESGSVWMQIRLALKKRVSAQEYANWLAPTAFSRLDSQDQILYVLVGDQVTIDFLHQEYRDRIGDVIAELKLPVRRIAYEIPEAVA